MSRILVGLTAVVLAGSCAARHPLGFSKGTTWTIPLIGAMGEGLAVTPVRINGKGPYLFFVNPDSATIIDPELAEKLGLWRDISQRTKLVNSKDDISHEQLTFFTVPSLSVGDLTLSNRQIVGLKARASFRGQPVMGIIGRDIFGQSSLIWSLDRDREVLVVATQGHFTPPVDARPVASTTRYGKTFVKARINDRITAELHVVFHGVSAIWPALAAQAGLGVVAGGAWLAETLQIGEVRARNLILLPFRDQRVLETEHDGVLGRGLWSRYNIAVNPHKNVIWLQPRTADPGALTEARLRRWKGLIDSPRDASVDSPAAARRRATLPSTVPRRRVAERRFRRQSRGGASQSDASFRRGVPWAGCEATACVTLEWRKEPSDSASPARSLVITRAASHEDASYDVLVEAVNSQGSSMGLPGILVVMPPGFTSLSVPESFMEGAYASAARFRVLDATPFPPPCDSIQGCFWLQQ